MASSEPKQYSTAPAAGKSTLHDRVARRKAITKKGGEPRLPARYTGAVELAVGGMGVIYQAFDQRLGRPVAVKHLQAAFSLDPKLLRRFEREARATAMLSHPAIVRIYDLLREDGEIFMIMELVPGRSLEDHLVFGPLEIRKALSLAVEIAEGVAEAHAHGIVHRDLKASNVMVTPSGHVKILDFGVAKSLFATEETVLTVGNAVIGTPYAMSPEQVKGLPVDTRSDLFSFGSLLYEMVTGEVPFLGSNPVQSLRLITEHQPPPADEVHPGVPAELARLIASLMEKDPERRPPEMVTVARELERIAAVLG